MVIDPNAPAFPTDAFIDAKPGRLPTKGLSIRAELAGKAMQGIIAAYSGPDIDLPDAERVAISAVSYADALIAELNKE